MPVQKIIVFLLQCPHLVLHRLILGLQARDKLLQLHTSQLTLQIFRQLRRDVLLLAHQKYNDRK